MIKWVKVSIPILDTLPLRRWYYLKVGNKIFEWRNRKKLVRHYIPNFTFIVWEIKKGEQPIALKELMKRRYERIK
jgi:hypothetical protein